MIEREHGAEIMRRVRPADAAWSAAITAGPSEIRIQDCASTTAAEEGALGLRLGDDSYRPK